jgi:hypothetical protein
MWNMDSDERKALLSQSRMLSARLERLSADSVWAHRASGLRGSILRCMERIEAAQGSALIEGDLAVLADLLNQASRILIKAASEIPADD